MVADRSEMKETGWVRMVDKQTSNYYYVNHETSSFSWVNPVAADETIGSPDNSPETTEDRGRKAPQTNRTVGAAPQPIRTMYSPVRSRSLGPLVEEEGGNPVLKNWERMLDPKTNHYYWVNHKLKMRSWVDPATDASLETHGSHEKTSKQLDGIVRAEQKSVHIMNSGSFATGAAPLVLPHRTAGQKADLDIALQQGPWVGFWPFANLEPQVITVGALSAEDNVHGSFDADLYASRRGRFNRSPQASVLSPQMGPREPHMAQSVDTVLGSSRSLVLHASAETCFPALYSSMPGAGQSRKMDGRTFARSPSPTSRINVGGGSRLVDRRHEAHPWKRILSPSKRFEYPNTAKYVSSPGVLEARGELREREVISFSRNYTMRQQEPLAANSSSRSRSRSPGLTREGTRRYNELYGSVKPALDASSRSVPGDTSVRTLSYTEQLIGMQKQSLSPVTVCSPLCTCTPHLFLASALSEKMLSMLIRVLPPSVPPTAFPTYLPFH